MIARLLSLFLLGCGLYFWWRWQRTPAGADRRKLLLNALLWGLILVIALLAATGRIHWLGAAFAALLVGLKQLGLLALRFFPALAQIYRPRTQSGDRSGPAADSTAMSLSEACRILEVKDDATAEEIKAAHRRQMSRQHPDHGGNAYFAAKLNQARDVLMAARRDRS